MSALTVLKAARTLLEDESRWTTGEYARDESGWFCGADDPTAVCWCAAGAVMKCNDAHDPEVEPKWPFDYLNEAANPVVVAHGKVGNAAFPSVTVNDELGHGAVLEMFDSAIKAAEAAEGEG